MMLWDCAMVLEKYDCSRAKLDHAMWVYKICITVWISKLIVQFYKGYKAERHKKAFLFWHLGAWLKWMLQCSTTRSCFISKHDLDIPIKSI